MLTLTALYTYPIKSVAGISLPAAIVQPRGLQYDRRWMLVDEEGRFISQRELPELTQLGIAIEPPYLTVFLKNNPGVRVSTPLEPAVQELQELEVQIWDDRCTARLLPDNVNGWFSNMLGRPLRLVYMADSTRRPADGRYAPAGQEVSFADGFPFLLIGEATLSDLNSRLAEPVPMNRFRPNFVFSGGAPFEEDTWRDFRIGDVPFRGVKPCARCIIPTTDQETGQRAAEPLKTLAAYRKWENKVLFGQNVVWMGATEQATIRVGDVLIC